MYQYVAITHSIAKKSEKQQNLGRHYFYIFRLMCMKKWFATFYNNWQISFLVTDRISKIGFSGTQKKLDKIKPIFTFFVNYFFPYLMIFQSFLKNPKKCPKNMAFLKTYEAQFLSIQSIRHWKYNMMKHELRIVCFQKTKMIFLAIIITYI